MITRRAVLPLLGLVPVCRNTADEDIPKPLPPPKIKLLFGGDVMLSRNVARIARQHQNPAWPMHELADAFRSADIAFVNLESPFSDRGYRTDEGMVFKAEPEMIATLASASIHIVSTANNHARDCDRYGVGYTLDWLGRHGIAAVGTAESGAKSHQGTVIERSGVKFGFLGYTYDQTNGRFLDIDDRVAELDVRQMRADVASILQRVDVAIVSMHAGIEYEPRPCPQQIEFARAAIDAGASIVVGHHPHVTQSWERRGSGVIFYSLGNLIFDQFQRAETQRGALAEVVFSGKTLESAAVLPVNIVQAVPRLTGERCSMDGSCELPGLVARAASASASR